MGEKRTQTMLSGIPNIDIIRPSEINHIRADTLILFMGKLFYLVIDPV